MRPRIVLGPPFSGTNDAVTSPLMDRLPLRAKRKLAIHSEPFFTIDASEIVAVALNLPWRAMIGIVTTVLRRMLI
jgi:hypothetical protein